MTGEGIDPTTTHEALVNESGHAQSGQGCEVFQLPMPSLSLPDHWKAKGLHFQWLSDTAAHKIHSVLKLHKHARVRRKEIIFAGGEQLSGKHECRRPCYTLQQQDRGLLESWMFDEYKDTFSVLTHGKVS